MSNCGYAKLLQGVVRQARKNRLVNLVFAERSLIAFVVEAPQPTSHIHGSMVAPQSDGATQFFSKRDGVSRAALGLGCVKTSRRADAIE
jgi:hypothetical protein